MPNTQASRPPFPDLLAEPRRLLSDALAAHDRVMILGYPGSGKTTLAEAVTDRPVLHLDYVQEVRWSTQWIHKATLFAMHHRRWLIEGTMGYRLVRTWLSFGGPLPERIILLLQNQSPQAKHDSFCRGLETVWLEAQRQPRFQELRIDPCLGLPPRPERPEFQLAGRLRSWPSAGMFIIEGKVDGVRMGALRRGGEWQFYNRIGRCRAPEHIARALPELPEDTWIDGEYDCGYGEQAGYHFLLSQNVPECGRWDVFDLTTHPPRPTPCMIRKAWLDSVLGPVSAHSEAIHLVEYALLDASQLRSTADRLMSREGVVIKEARSPYRPRTRKGWYKLKRDLCQASLW
ncbi:MAG: hypothetical protein JW940_04460 [Polyangiaceae bacterium]|nr:hypothetical protein [Polyangiaceae bacterium]